MNDKITITREIVETFAAYYHLPGNGAWGSLHIVLADGNVKDDHVDFCIEWARERGDMEGERLARLLRQMSKSQRGRLDRKVDELVACRKRQRIT